MDYLVWCLNDQAFASAFSSYDVPEEFDARLSQKVRGAEMFPNIEFINLKLFFIRDNDFARSFQNEYKRPNIGLWWIPLFV